MSNTLYHDQPDMSSADWMLKALRVLPQMVGSLKNRGATILAVNLSEYGRLHASIHVHECDKLKEWAESWGPIPSIRVRTDEGDYPYEVEYTLNGVTVYSLATDEEFRAAFPELAVSDG